MLNYGDFIWYSLYFLSFETVNLSRCSFIFFCSFFDVILLITTIRRQNMNNIYKVFVYGKSFVEACTESEAIDIALSVDLRDGVLKAELELMNEEVECSLNNPCPLAEENLDRDRQDLEGGCILGDICKKHLSFCGMKAGFKNPGAHLYAVEFHGVVYVEVLGEDDDYEEEAKQTAASCIARNKKLEIDRWTNVEGLELLSCNLKIVEEFNI